MRGLGGLGLLGFLAAFGIYMTLASGVGGGGGVSIPLAFGNPAGGEIDMDIVVGVLMARSDPMHQVEGGRFTWEKWISVHFKLEGSVGMMPLKRINNSAVIQEREVRGTQEFFMTTRLQIGQSYMLDYIPVAGQLKRYRYSFTAPGATAKVKNVTFEMVE